MTSTPDHSWSALLGNVDKYREDTGTDIDAELVPLSEGYVIEELMAHDVHNTHCPDLQHSHHQFNSSRRCPVYSDISSTSSLMADSQDPVPPRPSHKCHGNPTPELCLSPLQEPLHGGATGTSRLTEMETTDEAHLSQLSSYRTQMSIPDVCQKAKPKVAESTIEMSTQTERDMSDYPAQIPLPQPPPRPATVIQSNSRTSLNSATVGDVCRICHCESEPGAPLISPCVCCGSLKYVHQSCLQQWIKSADTKSCELCKFNFEMTTRIKPFRKWQKLEMTTVERRKIMCSVTFHIIAITCVIWSLYVLIDRTTEEIKMGILEWPFWTKLIVVAIGFTGGLVFMYVQCKMYVQLCRRWRAYNRVIYIQNCPNKTGQKIPLQPHMLDDNGHQKESTPANQTGVPVMQETELL